MPNDGVEQHLPLFKNIWKEVETMFRPLDILTKKGYAFVQTWAIKAAHPTLPYVMQFLCLLASLANGASARMFPNGGSPLFLCFFNVNYSQTRKSSLTAMADRIGDHLDEIVRQRVKEQYQIALIQQQSRTKAGSQVAAILSGQVEDGMDEDEAKDKGEAEPQGTSGKGPFPKMTSCVIHSSTPEAFFMRCSGDFKQITNSDKLKVGGFAGRPHHGVMAILDEAYDFLQPFGFISEEAKPNNAKNTKVNPHQSTLNKLMQFGQASRATKTCGSFGDGKVAAVSGSVSGNLHPSIYVPMERAECGTHHAMAKERFTVATQEPVQPHAPLPDDYKVPSGHIKWKWVPLVPPVAEVLGLTSGIVSAEAAENLWKKARPTETSAMAKENCEQNENDSSFVPDASGFLVTLPDGVPSRVRFRLDPNEATGLSPEWRIANRDFPAPPEHDLKDAVLRVCSYFDKPHMELEFEDAALRVHQSYQGAYNVQAHQLREGGDVQGGARLGVAPWLLGILAALLMIFDIFSGEISRDSEAFKARALKITQQHVKRAHSLLNVLTYIKEMVVAASTPGVTGGSGPTEAKEAAKMEALLRSATAAEMLWSQSDFLSATQIAEASFEELFPEPPTQAPESAMAGDAPGQESSPAVSESPSSQQVSQADFVGGTAPPPAPSVIIVGKDDVKDTTYGYGPDGKSVQTALHGHLTDRYIMRYTLLQGKPVITAKEVCDKLKYKVEGRATKKALERDNWTAVMEAGLTGATVAQLMNPKTSNTQIAIRAIPSNKDEKTKYHNELMNLCGLTLRELTEAMATASGKAKGAKKSVDIEEKSASETCRI